MNELLQSVTSLPNLHPAVVHFPIALLPVALLFDLLALLSKQRWLERGGSLLYGLAALGAGGAYWAGKEAGDALIGVPPRVQAHIANHSDWALYTLWALGIVVALRLAVSWWGRRGAAAALRPARWGLFLAGVAAFGLLLRTADLGGGLVFRHGVAVATDGAEDLSDEGARTASSAGGSEGPASEDTPWLGPATERLVRGEDGSLRWSPAATDADALGAVLEAASGSSLAAVRVAEPLPGEEGLAFAVDGRALFVLPGSFGDVHVEAVLDLRAFAGTVGLAHHVRSAEAAGLFTASTGGEVALISLEEGRRKVLDQQRAALPDGPATLAVSSAGRHLKGLIGGKTLVHGHVAAPADGSCGLLVDGSGRIRVISIEVTPVG